MFKTWRSRKNSHKTLIQRPNILKNNSLENITSDELLTEFKSRIAETTFMLKGLKFSTVDLHNK